MNSLTTSPIAPPRNGLARIPHQVAGFSIKNLISCWTFRRSGIQTVFPTEENSTGNQRLSEKPLIGEKSGLTFILKRVAAVLLVSALAIGTQGCSDNDNNPKTVADSGGGAGDGGSGGNGNSGNEDPARTADQFATDAYCSRMAAHTFDACKYEVKDDFFIGQGNCINISDESDRTECLAEVDDAVEEDETLCQDQFDARQSICSKIGEARFDPDFDPANFIDPDTIGVTVAVNPYLPLVVGNKWVWEGGEEVITDTVIDKIKLIEGVKCRVVLDVVEEDGEIIEITDDWYAQDISGNVWYCGESARDFETFDGDDPEEPELVEIDGSWKAGRDHARPGLLLPFAPQVGQAYRQEVLLGDAEDFAEVTNLSGNETVPATDASCTNDCLVTNESSPIEPGIIEIKHYKPGIGLILEVPPEGPRVELTEFTQAAP